MSPRVLLDVDGVLADFRGGVERALRAIGHDVTLASQGDIWSDMSPAQAMAARREIGMPGFFAHHKSLVRGDIFVDDTLAHIDAWRSEGEELGVGGAAIYWDGRATWETIHLAVHMWTLGAEAGARC